MAVKTGYKKAELLRAAEAIRAQGAALTASLPAERLWDIHLACQCDRCIDPDVLPALRKTPAPDLTDKMVSQYFGGLGAMGEPRSDEAQIEARFEARVMATHVLRQLGEAICLSGEEARAYKRNRSYLEPDYLLPNLIRTGFIAHLAPDTRLQITSYLLDVARHASATGSITLDDALCYLSLFTDAFPAFLEEVRSGSPRRHLRFWTAIARGVVSGATNDRERNGKDIHLFYSGMPSSDRERLMDALAAPEVERIIERYALAAGDEDWLRYLSRLLRWREKTILQSRFSDLRGKEPGS